MSTRCSIWWTRHLHYYRDQMDDTYYLEITTKRMTILVPVWPLVRLPRWRRKP